MSDQKRGRSIQLTETGRSQVKDAMILQNINRSKLASLVYGTDSNKGRIGQWLNGTRSIDEQYAWTIFKVLGLKMRAGESRDFCYTGGSDNTLSIECLPPWRQMALRFTVGRDADVERLEQDFKRFKSAGRRLAVAGLGGLGKTTLALLYAQKYARRYRHRLFLDARSVNALENEYLALAEEISRASDTVAKALEYYRNFPGSTEFRSELIRRVLDWLGETPGWLLILDNADCYTPMAEEASPLTVDALSKLLPVTPANSHLLLTTRNLSFPDELDIPILPGFTVLKPEDAVAFLLERTAPLEELTDVQREAMAHLARKMEYLPLALEQAAAYIRVTQDFANYERLFDAQGIGQLEHTEGERTPYHSTLIRTWQITFEEIRHTAPQSADIFLLSSFLSPQAIPFEIIVALDRGETESAFPVKPLTAQGIDRCQRLMRPLRDLALVKTDNDNNTFNIHTLLHQVTRESLPVEDQQHWLNRAIILLNRLFPRADLGSKSAEPERRLGDRLISHVEALAGRMRISDSLPAHRLLRSAGLYCTWRGRYASAETLLLKALEVFDDTDATHPETAVTMKCLGDLYYWMQRLSDAQLWLEKAVRFWGNDGPDVSKERRLEYASALSELGIVMAEQADGDRAERLHREALEIRRSLLSEHDPLVAESLSNLGFLKLGQHDYEAAESLFLPAAQIRRAAFSEDHEQVAKSLNNLALVYRHQGRYEEAEPHFLEAVRMYKSVENDAGYGIALGNLATLCHLDGRQKQAMPLFEEALAVLVQTFGPEYSRIKKLNGLREECLAKLGTEP